MIYLFSGFQDHLRKEDKDRMEQQLCDLQSEMRVKLSAAEENI